MAKGTALCLGNGCHTTGLYLPEEEHRERGRGQHWKISFVGKTWFVIGESEANTRTLYGHPFVLS